MGLSPRVRGNPSPEPSLLFHPGSIPACAGEPSKPPVWPIQGRVYPRVCGGTNLEMLGGAAEAGLSPRVRGNLLLLT